MTPQLSEQFLLRDNITYLNHGSFGACPRPVFEAYQHRQLELERDPVAYFHALAERMAAVRARVGRFVGADPDDLVLVPNATTGLNIVARSLPLQPGDEVLGTGHEYGALERTWRYVCGRRGARYVRAELPLPVESPDQLVEAIWAGVTRATRVLFISHITSPTALTLPVETLVTRAREAGLITVVDGAHAPGQLDLDLDALGADFYSGNLHKWALAPKGCAFLHARRATQELIEPLVVSWGWEPEEPGPSRFIDEQEGKATDDYAAYLAAPDALDFLVEHDWRRVRERCHDLVREAREAVAALTGRVPLQADDPALFRQMVACELPPCDARALRRRLRHEHAIEVPIHDEIGPPIIRISIQAYNSREHIERLIEALEGEL